MSIKQQSLFIVGKDLLGINGEFSKYYKWTLAPRSFTAYILSILSEELTAFSHRAFYRSVASSGYPKSERPKNGSSAGPPLGASAAIWGLRQEQRPLFGNTSDEDPDLQKAREKTGTKHPTESERRVIENVEQFCLLLSPSSLPLKSDWAVPTRYLSPFWQGTLLGQFWTSTSLNQTCWQTGQRGFSADGWELKSITCAFEAGILKWDIEMGCWEPTSWFPF